LIKHTRTLKNAAQTSNNKYTHTQTKLIQTQAQNHRNTQAHRHTETRKHTKKNTNANKRTLNHTQSLRKRVDAIYSGCTSKIED